MSRLARLAPLLSLAVFARSVTYGFTLDDANTVAGHPGVTGPLAFDDVVLRDFWGRSFVNTIGSWRPVATLALWGSWHVGGGRPWPFHVANLVVAGLLLVAADRFLERFFGAALAAWTRALALFTFGVLALHADVVPSPTGCAELLAALFALVALTLPLRAGPPRVGDAVASALAVGLAIGAKESALPIALLVPVLAYRWHASRGTVRGAGLLALALANALVLSCVVAFRVLRMPFMTPGPERAAENPLLDAGPVARLFGAGEVFARYLGHVAWPARLAPDYSYAAFDVGRASALAVLGLALAAGLALFAWRARRAIGVTDAALGFGASYLVVSHALVPAIAVVADRLFFFPSFWLVALAALGLERAARAVCLEVRGRAMRRAGVALCIAFATGQSIVAVRDGAHWREDATLLAAAVRARPTVARARRNLAQLLADRGDPEAAAWQLVVSMAILTHLPEPIAADAYPSSWDDAPLPARLDALRAREGDAALRREMAYAASTFRRWGSEAPASLLDRWGAPAPP